VSINLSISASDIADEIERDPDFLIEILDRCAHQLDDLPQELFGDTNYDNHQRVLQFVTNLQIALSPKAPTSSPGQTALDTQQATDWPRDQPPER